MTTFQELEAKFYRCAVGQNVDFMLKHAESFLRERKSTIKLWIRCNSEQSMAYITYGDSWKPHFKTGGKNIQDAILNCVKYYLNFIESNE